MPNRSTISGNSSDTSDSRIISARSAPKRSHLPGIFDETIFSKPAASIPSSFIRVPRPRAQILPTPEAVARILGAGWTGQVNIRANHLQIHIPSNEENPVVIYNPTSHPHRRKMPDLVLLELR